MFAGLTLTELRYAGYALVMAAVCGGLLYLHHSIYTEGAASTETKYVIRDAGAAKAAADRIQVLERAARATEAQHAANMAQITTKLRNDNAAEQVKHDAVVAGLRDGTVKLWVNSSCADAGCRTEACSTGAATPGTDGAGNTGLLGPADSAFLVDQASRADRAARKVNALQALVLDQIRTCNQ